jgi:probable F420-dependent oxidoreductase
MSEGAPRTPMPDPLETLAFVAAVTTTLRLGTAVVVAPLHSPAVLAKRAATLDRLSDGRFTLGLGIGWQVEEYAAVGVPYQDRGRRLEECIGAMRALWGPQPASFSGRYVSFDRVHSIPSPASGAVPVLLGGHSPAAVKRAGRLADGWFPFTISPDEFEDCMKVLGDAATAAGRSPDAVEVTCWPGSAGLSSLDDVRRYVSVGASRVVMGAGITRPDQLGELRADLLRFQDEVIARL